MVEEKNSFKELPIIDVSALFTNNEEEFDKLAEKLHKACKEVGFFYISNHNVPEELQSNLHQLSQQFFSQPVEKKMEIAMEKAGKQWRGFFKLGAELTSGRPDQKEGIYFGTEHSNDDKEVINQTPMHGQNLWPDIPHFSSTVLEYLQRLTELGQLLMSGVAKGLGLPKNYFLDRFTTNPTILFRVFNYPFVENAQEKDEWGVREHTDMGFLTILKQDNSSGLQVRNQSDDWIEVPPIENTFVVNIGDMLELWTHGLYVATSHRVRNPLSSDRLSFPFFFDPNWNSSLEPIERSLLEKYLPNEENDLQRRKPSKRWDGVDLSNISASSYGEYVWPKISNVFPWLVNSNPTN